MERTPGCRGRSQRASGARLGQPRADVVAHVGIDLGELVIDAAGLGAAVEPGQRLAEIIEAVGGALAARIVLVIGEQDARRGRRLVVVEIGAALQVARPARPAAVGIAGRGGLQRGLRLGIVALVPEPVAGIIGLLGGVGGAAAPARRAAPAVGRGLGAGVAAAGLGRAARPRRRPRAGGSSRSSRAARSVRSRAICSSSWRVRLPFSSTWPVSARSCASSASTRSVRLVSASPPAAAAGPAPASRADLGLDELGCRWGRPGAGPRAAAARAGRPGARPVRPRCASAGAGDARPARIRPRR